MVEIPLQPYVRRVQALLESFNTGFNQGIMGDDSSQVPEFTSDDLRTMWWEGWHLAKHCLEETDV